MGGDETDACAQRCYVVASALDQLAHRVDAHTSAPRFHFVAADMDSYQPPASVVDCRAGCSGDERCIVVDQQRAAAACLQARCRCCAGRASGPHDGDGGPLAVRELYWSARGRTAKARSAGQLLDGQRDLAQPPRPPSATRAHRHDDHVQHRIVPPEPRWVALEVHGAADCAPIFRTEAPTRGNAGNALGAGSWGTLALDRRRSAERVRRRDQTRPAGQPHQEA